MTKPCARQIAAAMLEGSFIALLWLAPFALVTEDPHYRELALAAIAAVSLAIAAILAIPARWLRRASGQPAGLAAAEGASAKAGAISAAPATERPRQRHSAFPSGLHTSPHQEPRP